MKIEKVRCPRCKAKIGVVVKTGFLQPPRFEGVGAAPTCPTGN